LPPATCRMSTCCSLPLVGRQAVCGNLLAAVVLREGGDSEGNGIAGRGTITLG